MSQIAGKSKEMLLLSFLSYLTVFYKTDHKKQIKELNTLLHQEGVDIDLDSYKIVWGPAFHNPPLWRFARLIFKKIFSDTLIFVLEHKEIPGEYTVVIRGTNPISIYSWFYYDLKVHKMHQWNKSDKTQGRVSAGAYSAFQNICKVKPRHGYAGHNTTILKFLEDLINKTNGKLKLNVTGHSLGGVMASTVGLYLNQLYQDKIDLNVYSFAAPTAGDKDFASFTNKQLGETCLRYANKLDIAPLAWNEKTLQTTPTLYKGVKPSCFMRWFIRKAIKDARGNDYTQINVKKPLLVKDCDNPLYIYHMAYHHVIGYLIAAGFKEDLIEKIFQFVVNKSAAPRFIKKAINWLIKHMVD